MRGYAIDSVEVFSVFFYNTGIPETEEIAYEKGNCPVYRPDAFGCVFCMFQPGRHLKAR
jgi:hypothetical protein